MASLQQLFYLPISIIIVLFLFMHGCSLNSSINATEINTSQTSINQSSEISALSEQPKSNSTNYQINKLEKIVNGNSMAPLLKNGDTVILLENYYRCGNHVKNNDLIAYNYTGSENPLIKRVRATDTDIIEIAGNKLKINSEILKNSAEEEYIFSLRELKMLQLYIKNSHIPKDSFLIFGDNIHISTDSRRFGAVSASNFLGKFNYY